MLLYLRCVNAIISSQTEVWGAGVGIEKNVVKERLHHYNRTTGKPLPYHSSP